MFPDGLHVSGIKIHRMNFFWYTGVWSIKSSVSMQLKEMRMQPSSGLWDKISQNDPVIKDKALALCIGMQHIFSIQQRLQGSY